MTSPPALGDDLLADRYQLVERIATGGMGEVWRAQDLLLDRPVAVKTLRAEYVDDPDFRARFRNEARHAARLSHAGIASVYDFGELPDRAWLVMELVDGEPLSGLLRREGTLTADRALDVVAQTAAALQVAHDAGVVHRDVKPGNLLVRPDGVVKVTDFGIASAGDAVPLTRTGQVVGTAYYLSPEQASGRAGTPASDLYSLGVVAYECLAGVRPFPGDSPIAVAMAHVSAPPPSLPAGVPVEVRELVEGLLAKDPADRPGPASVVAARAVDLRTRLSGSGLASLPVDPPAAARPDGAQDVTRALPHPDEPGTSLLPRPVPVRTAAPAGPTSHRTQRRAVRLTAVLLALLAVAFGVRGALSGGATSAGPRTIAVPSVAVGSAEAAATGALDAASLEVSREVRPSATVAKGRVVATRPAAGTRVDEGSTVVLVVSSGPPPVRVSASALVGRPAADARSTLATRGLLPRLVYDGKGTAVGTVSAVEPVGDVAVGTAVVLHVVPAPAPATVAPAPVQEADKGKGSKGKGKR